MSDSSERAPLPLTFGVSGGYPRVDLALRVEADGSALVDVLTAWSLAQPSPARLGAFRGRLPGATIEALAAVASASRERALSAPSAPFAGPPGTVVRMVSAGGERPVPAVGDESRLAALDRDIAAAAAAALADPIAAIVAEARTGDGGPVLALRAIGTEPFRLLLFASDTPGFWARTWIDTAAGQQPLEFEDVERLVAAGAITAGPIELEPGSEVLLPIPAGAAHGSAGGYIAWRRGTGPERRIVSGAWALPGAAP
ncbi:MAG: hypothetical protein WCK58_01635 [Chloroflexota bacterium]